MWLAIRAPPMGRSIDSQHDVLRTYLYKAAAGDVLNRLDGCRFITCPPRAALCARWTLEVRIGANGLKRSLMPGVLAAAAGARGISRSIRG